MVSFLILNGFVFADLIDPNVPGVSLRPLVYLPFENSNGVFGHGTGSSNPAWANQVNGEAPEIIDRSADGAMVWPLVGKQGSVCGEYLDFSSLYGISTKSDVLTFRNESGPTLQSLKNAKSCTYTFWIRTGDPSANGSGTFAVRGPINTMWRTDGRFQVQYWPTTSWEYSNWNYVSQGKWVFVAIVCDNTGITFYEGDEDTAPVFNIKRTGSTGPGPVTPWVYVGFYSYVNAVYPNYDIDQIRIWADPDGQSAALSLDDITDVWQYDYDPLPQCVQDDAVLATDINQDCVVNLDDFTVLAANWLAGNPL
jgi:hypothetical protein